MHFEVVLNIMRPKAGETIESRSVLVILGYSTPWAEEDISRMADESGVVVLIPICASKRLEDIHSTMRKTKVKLFLVCIKCSKYTGMSENILTNAMSCNSIKNYNLIGSPQIQYIRKVMQRQIITEDQTDPYLIKDRSIITASLPKSN